MASLKSLLTHLSRALTFPLPKSTTQSLTLLLLTGALFLLFFSAFDTSPAATTTKTLLYSRLHSASTYVSSLSSIVSSSTTTCAGSLAVCPVAAVENRRSWRKTHVGDVTSCDIFDGKWVMDGSDPIYKPGSCPFMGDSFNCFKNGRPDGDYLKLRWKPHGCQIPRSKPTSIPLQSTYVYAIWDYNCSIDFIKSPFLVQEWKISDKAGTRRETLRLDMIQGSSTQYHDADIIIFNTGHWNNYFQEGNRVYSKLEVADAYTRALRTWAQWVDANINHTRTRVFFRGYSASHFRGGQWNSGGNCDGETQPITDDAYLAPYPWMMNVLESVISEMKTPVFYLNITKMTDYRKDGHPSIFREAQGQRYGGMVQDCSHWCLPGVPDSWNELLYATLLISHQCSLK
ncbi:hypothetical protein LguiA_031251 [Lonicera macranthoides]